MESFIMRGRSRSMKARRDLIIRSLVSVFALLGLLVTVSLYRATTSSVRSNRISTRDYDQVLSHYQSSSCEDVHKVSEQCAFVKRNCQEDDTGILPYIDFYFCDTANLKPLGFIALLCWLSILFVSIGISASDFLCVNLATISNMLGMSQTFAGVTFLAFGNGSPDVFSTWAAFKSHSGSLAIGELIGAAGFIVSVIAGSMALIRPFKVSRKSFVRDASFFTAAAAFSLYFLIDGRLMLWECGAMVAFYLLYVAVVLVWHSMAHRRGKQREQQSRSREHFLLLPGDERLNEERFFDSPPYFLGDLQDQPCEDNNNRNDYLSVPPDSLRLQSGGEDEDVDREQFLATVGKEIRRTHNRSLSRSATSSQPIRPSLLGVREFETVLASLQRSQTEKRHRLPLRRHSHHIVRQSNDAFSSQGQLQATGVPSQMGSVHNSSLLDVSADSHNTRLRSVSAGAAELLVPSMEHNIENLPPTVPTTLRIVTAQTESPEIASSTIGDRSPVPTIALNDDIILPSNMSFDGCLSPTLPFPAYRDEADDSAATLQMSTNDVETLVFRGDDSILPEVTRQARLLPTLSDVKRTLFPTLEDFATQSISAKLISLATIPTVFVLTLTVPVVSITADRERTLEAGQLGVQSLPANYDYNASISSDTIGRFPIENPQYHAMAAASSISETADNGESANTTALHTADRVSKINNATKTDTAIELMWKPWLVMLQMLFSPMFVLLVFAADNAEDQGISAKWTLLILLACLVAIVIFAVIADSQKPPTWQKFIAFPGFCVSILWVSLIAGEVVGLLKTIGVITQISDAILGLTVFAMGNSLSDLLANLAIARLGYPVMALSACFGGPMLNILLGIGLGGSSMILKKGHSHKHYENGLPPLSTQFKIDIGRSLTISGVGLLITLVGLLIAVPLNGWVMDRKIGFALIAIWIITTTVNITLEIVL